MDELDALRLVLALALSERPIDWPLVALIAGTGAVAGGVTAWLVGALWRRIR